MGQGPYPLGVGTKVLIVLCQSETVNSLSQVIMTHAFLYHQLQKNMSALSLVFEIPT